MTWEKRIGKGEFRSKEKRELCETGRGLGVWFAIF